MGYIISMKSLRDDDWNFDCIGTDDGLLHQHFQVSADDESNGLMYFFISLLLVSCDNNGTDSEPEPMEFAGGPFDQLSTII